MIKSSTDELLQVILNIINKIKKLSIYPDIWAMGLTSLIFKDGDEKNPKNYRAINVGNTLSKVFVSIIYEIFNDITKQINRGLPNRIQKRPSDHIFVLISAIDKYLGNGKKCMLVLLITRKRLITYGEKGYIIR